MAEHNCHCGYKTNDLSRWFLHTDKCYVFGRRPPRLKHNKLGGLVAPVPKTVVTGMGGWNFYEGEIRGGGYANPEPREEVHRCCEYKIISAFGVERHAVAFWQNSELVKCKLFASRDEANHAVNDFLNYKEDDNDNQQTN